MSACSRHYKQTAQPKEACCLTQYATRSPQKDPHVDRVDFFRGLVLEGIDAKGCVKKRARKEILVFKTKRVHPGSRRLQAFV